MENKLYVGNLAFSIAEDSLLNTFASVGSVASVKLVKDRDTGRARGFGFVEMESESLAQKAIEQLNGMEIEGREIMVSLAKPQSQKRERVFEGQQRGSRSW